ncbi:MAG TPA: glycosyltransferase family 39 protein, partial [Humibacillus sp.]|nr:glycosyltransferase family 39 protein [Humibacillus sp.]
MSVSPRTEPAPAVGVQGRERWVAAAACLVLAGLHLAIAARFGALGVSRNDDWTYYRVALATYADGGFSPDPFTSTMLVGLIALAQPVMAVFGASIAALQVMVALLGAVGLWAAWLLVRRFLDPGAAAVAVLTLALGPLWGTMSATFMSDVPAFAFQALALAAAGAALRTPDIRWGWFAASLVLCFAALTIREYAVAATVAVIAVGMLRARGRQERLAVLLAGLAWVALAVALLAWRAGLVTGAPSRSVLVPGPEEAKTLVRTVYTTGLLLSPAVVVHLVRSRGVLVRRHWRCALITLAVLVAGIVVTERTVLLGNYVTLYGSYPETVSGPLPVVVIAPIWALIVGVAVLGSTILVTMLWAALRDVSRHRRRSPELLTRLRGADPALLLSLTFATALIVTVLVIGVVVHNRIFDRYLLPMTPYAAAVVLWPVRRPSSPEAVERPAPRWSVS